MFVLESGKSLEKLWRRGGKKPGQIQNRAEGKWDTVAPTTAKDSKAAPFLTRDHSRNVAEKCQYHTQEPVKKQVMWLFF